MKGKVKGLAVKWWTSGLDLMEPDVNTILSFWKAGVKMVCVHT